MTENPALKISSFNRKIYRRLKLALSLQLRRQIFIVACDNLLLRDRLALSLQEELNNPSFGIYNGSIQPSEKLIFPRLVSLRLSLRYPNPLAEISKWLTENPQPKNVSSLPAFQIWGVEQLTRQPPAVQWSFINYLQEINSTSHEWNLVLWVPQPWLVSIKQSAPEFWNLRTGVFEFEGEPTPSPLTNASHDNLYYENFYEENPTAHSQSRNRKGCDRISKKSFVTDNSIDNNVSSWENITAAQLTADTVTVSDFDKTSEEKATSEISPGDDTTKIRDSILVATNAETSLEKKQPEENVEIKEINQSLEKLFIFLSQETENQVHFQPLIELANLIKDAASENASWEMSLLQKQSLQILEALAYSYQQAASPNALATAYHRLGDLWRDCISRGDSTLQSLTIAIHAYEKMLELLQGVATVEPDTLNALGNLYWMFSRNLTSLEQKILYLEKAIQAYEAALINIQPQEQTQLCATIQNNLGAVYSDLARYCAPADNLEKAVKAYQAALEYCRLTAENTDSSAIQYAATVNNLGTAYWNLAQHRNSVTNLKQAIATYNEAIRYYTPTQHPLEYAMIQNNLGTAYWNLAQYEQPENYLLLAISAYEVALKYRTPQVAPGACAATQNNLGTAYWHLANYYKRKPKEYFQYLQQALAAYEATLYLAEQLANNSQTAKPLTFDIYSTHNNLALVHYQLATDSSFPIEQDSRLHHLETALHHHLQALNGWHDQPEFYEKELNFVIQNIRTFYREFGLQGQIIALSKVPANLLPEILPKL
ncbi:MAG: tetratricopeptide repeat protein [Oscillatoriaceae bacterium SKW80]|nr:tetratricopeptide repeat protein [Oscillatoriaceae bacterium SKYG93]MCX8120818.1 tetratricopeptide repeat protein [Oscillatoriaceae bacterium SKW80]MDW8453696.1 tetratricopeptide repeat protein [Oscillatoriaceae cyanobacterium SKYGB_i_bin93]HIK27711.1 tetratricopeptide repeat protein [Oscillatoriaceae cyanobacterium M7585_C2015_266]